MTKTIEEWREELNALFLKSSAESLKIMHDMQSEIIIAFIAKYKLQPEEVIMCFQNNTFWVEKKNNKLTERFHGQV